MPQKRFTTTLKINVYAEQRIKMTTPQEMLHKVYYRINDLMEMFSPEENGDGEIIGDSIFDSVKQIQSEVSDLMSSQQRIENQLNLIIKLLSKNASTVAND